MALPGDVEARKTPLEMEAVGGLAESAPYNLDKYVEWATDRACEGRMGKYQIRVMILIASNWLITAIHTYSWSFITVEPDVKPENILPWSTGRVLILDGTDTICSSTEIEDWGPICPELRSDQCVPLGGENMSNSDFRDLWTYRDPQNSAVAEFDLSDCSASPTFATFIGQFFWYAYATGVLCSGPVSDALGRKKTYTIFLSVMMLGGIVQAIASNRWILAVGRFVNAFGIGGTGITGFVWASESVNKEGQPFMTWVPNLWFILGAWIQSILTIWVLNWRQFEWIMALGCIPFFAATTCYESPKWLAAKKMRPEVVDAMKGISLANGKTEPPPPSAKRSATEEIDEEEQAAPGIAPSQPETSSALCHPKVLPRLLVNAALWFVVSMGYYGLSLFPPPPLFSPTTIKYGAVLDYCFGFAVEFPAYYVSGFVIDTRLGRKGACPGFIFVAGVCMWIAGTQPQLPDGEQLPGAVALFYTLLYYVARMFQAAGFAVIYPWSSELFPSSIRGSCMGFVSFFARMGSSFAPLAGEITPFSLRMTTFGVPLTIVSAVALCVLPETKGKPLPGTVDDL